MSETNTKTVLIAEDEKSYSRALVLKLQHSGFSVHTAENGSEALDKLKKEKIDLLLLDLIMPKMDGFTVLENMKNAGISTPVMVLSNLGQQDDEKKARKFGAIDFLNKSNMQIIDIISKVQLFFNK